MPDRNFVRPLEWLPQGGLSLDLLGNIPQDTILGRNSPGAGAVEALTAAEVSAMIGAGGTITLSGDVSGSGTTSIVVTIEAGVVTNAMLAGSIDLTTKVTGLLPSANGGTGNGFAKFSGPTTAEKTFTLPNATCTILTTNAVVTAGQGGTGQSTYTLGDTIYCSASNTLSKLAGNTTTTKQYLSQTGNGSVSAAPGWATIAQADITGLKTTDSPTFGGITCTASNAGVQRFTFRNTNSGSSAYCALDFGNDTGSSTAEFLLCSSTNTTYAGANGFAIICSADIIFHLGGSERMRWKSGGDVLIGTSTAPTGTTGKTLMLGANGGNAVPGTGIAGLFAKTVTQTEMFAVDSAGNITQISKHYDPDLATAAGIVIDPDDDYPQIDCEENPFLGVRALTYRGQRILIDLPPEECMDWDAVQFDQQAAHAKRAQDWTETVRAHADAVEKHALAMEEWERLDPIVKVFKPRPEPPRELDLTQDPGTFARQECPPWIAKIIERRKGKKHGT